MNQPPYRDPREPPTDPMGVPVVRERVVEDVGPAGFDPALLVQIDDRLRSLRTGIALVGVIAVAALLVGLYAAVRAHEADRRASPSTSPSAQRVAELEERVEDLAADIDRRTRRRASDRDVAAVAQAVDDKADAEDLTSLERTVVDLQGRVDELGEGAPDAVTDLDRRLQDLERRVQALEQGQ